MNDDLTDEQIDVLRDELHAGRKIAAVKLCREWTDCSLVDAKNRVESIGESSLGDGLNSNLGESVIDEVLDAIQNGNKLEAVKLYRESSGASLMESKTFVERLMKELGIESQPRGGCAGLVLGAVLATGITYAVVC